MAEGDRGPRLVVLNGPPGCGKSTLARMYAEDHPLALNLDIDRIRALIGRWPDQPAAGLLARRIALAAARVHLAAGHDVVIPQFLGRPEFLEQVDQVAGETGAEFYEIVLMDTRENALRRFTERGRADLAPAEAQGVLDRAGGPDGLSVMYDRLMRIVASRPAARVVPTRAGQVDQAYRDFLAVLGD